MQFESLLLITPNPVTSALIWLSVAVLLLYFGRSPMQRAIHAVFRMLHNATRLAMSAVMQTARYLRERNREVLLAAGREAKERIIEREFERISATVDRDLSRYPESQRLLSEVIQRIDEEHQNATEVPPEVPGWTKAVEAIGKIPAKADNSLRDILEAIHGAVKHAQARALYEYRKESRTRHRLLSRMMPEWRRIQHTLNAMQKSVSSILERSRSIDRHIAEYQGMVQGTDRAVQSLSSSSMVQFFVSALVIAVAVGGAIINFSLISRPMTEMVGGTAYIGNFRMADIAALVIILVEISMGLFLMESLRITRLFPVIAALPDHTRKRMIWITFSILTALASIEAGLAFMREMLLQDELATSALLRGEEGAILGSDALWITTAANMGMGFILPFALTFVAIPLESFIHSLRTVLGGIVTTFLNSLALALRLVAGALRQLDQLMIQTYDLAICVPLWLEQKIRARRLRAQAQTLEDAPPERDAEASRRQQEQPGYATRSSSESTGYSTFGEVSA